MNDFRPPSAPDRKRSGYGRAKAACAAYGAAQGLNRTFQKHMADYPQVYEPPPTSAKVLYAAKSGENVFTMLRRIGLAHTRFAEATCGTLRLALLRIGAQVRRSVRRIKLAMASAHPFQDEFALAHARLAAATGC